MRNEVVLKKNLVWAMWKCVVFMTTPYIILENRGRLTITSYLGSTYPRVLKLVSN